MADDKEKGEKKEFEVEGEMEGSASVTELKQKDSGGNEPHCLECGGQLYDGHCINSECPAGQAWASRGAAAETRKAAAGSAPRAFTSRGRVD